MRRKVKRENSVSIKYKYNYLFLKKINNCKIILGKKQKYKDTLFFNWQGYTDTNELGTEKSSELKGVKYMHARHT